MKKQQCWFYFVRATAVVSILSATLSGRVPDAVGAHLPGGPSAAACSPDGKFYVAVSQKGVLRYVRAEDGRVLHSFYHCAPEVLAFSADGRFLAAGGQMEDGHSRIRVWNVSTGGRVCQFDSGIHSKPLLSFSPNGLWLASTGGKSRIYLWHVARGVVSWSATTPVSIAQIEFSPGGDAVIARCDDGTTRQFRVQ